MRFFASSSLLKIEGGRSKLGAVQCLIFLTAPPLTQSSPSLLVSRPFGFFSILLSAAAPFSLRPCRFDAHKGVSVELQGVDELSISRKGVAAQKL